MAPCLLSSLATTAHNKQGAPACGTSPVVKCKQAKLAVAQWMSLAHRPASSRTTPPVSSGDGFHDWVLRYRGRNCSNVNLKVGELRGSYL